MLVGVVSAESEMYVVTGGEAVMQLRVKTSQIWIYQVYEPIDLVNPILEVVLYFSLVSWFNGCGRRLDNLVHGMFLVRVLE
jgi:hypothetical protein